MFEVEGQLDNQSFSHKSGETVCDASKGRVGVTSKQGDREKR